MSEEEIVTALDGIDHSDYDNERIHSEADHLLYRAAPPAVQAAYDRVQAKSSFWYS